MLQEALAVFRSLFALFRQLASLRRWPDDDDFIRALYRAFLLRVPDPEGADYYRERLRHHSLSWWGVVRSVMQSSEYKQLRGLPIHPLDACHQTRMMLVRHHLPPADVIVDLGGASASDPRGALLEMGYPHTPRELYIVDLPPDVRLLHSPETSQHLTTDDGTAIHFLYRSMADLSPLADGSVDLVFSGESIEHISEADADAVCQEVFRVLRPGGAFCLDTPNAALTRLQSPDELIHPEHQKEYLVHELRDKLVRGGFDVVEEKALCPMPESLRTGHFDYAELVRNIRLSDTPTEGYLFYLKAIKPAS